ncbi:sensor histidine kinase [Paenibacillus faecalis]|uniref:sensor histidine kinase n=1 Tax=Paenibacillus faecalis TaxID=2079532 RepID=UPI000D105FE5|nr:ATP-binding protein [Paenibacillus faecalis]
MRLRSKIYLYSSVLFSILLIAVNLSVYLLFQYMSVSNEMKRVEQEAKSTVEGIQQFADSIPPDDLLRAFPPLNGMIRIVHSDGTSFSSTSPTEDQLIELKREYDPKRKTERITMDGNGYVWVSVPVIWPSGEVVNIQLVESMAETESRLKTLRSVLIGVTLIALIPAILSSGILADRVMNPITSMIRTMKDILMSGRFKRLSLKGPSKDELTEMGETFNQMIDMLEASFERQERFVSDASHELKTPLTIIESYASLLKRRGKERPELFDEAVEAILSESIRMREMTEQLLMLARKPEQWNVTVEAVDLSKLTEETVRAFRNAYHRDISLIVEKSIWHNTDQSKLKQLLFILLDNARKYSKESITVRVYESDTEKWISVTDQGIGIPKEELDKVFDRFYRIDPARTRKSGAGGSGLGLSLAKDIAGAIGARITLDSEEGKGTTASVVFSLVNESKASDGNSGSLPSKRS